MLRRWLRQSTAVTGGGVPDRYKQVVVWDTSRDEPLLATTKIDDLFHREPVTSVSPSNFAFARSLSRASAPAERTMDVFLSTSSCAFLEQTFGDDQTQHCHETCSFLSFFLFCRKRMVAKGWALRATPGAPIVCALLIRIVWSAGVIPLAFIELISPLLTHVCEL